MKTLEEKLAIAVNALQNIYDECGALAEWDGDEDPTIEDIMETEDVVDTCQEIAEKALNDIQ